MKHNNFSNEPKLLSETQVAAMVGMSVYWLQKSRLHGTGPSFVKIGRSVRYPHTKVTSWISQQEILNSTSNQGQTA